MPEFTSDNQPSHDRKKRGKAFKTLLLEAIREEALLEVPSNASKEVAEKAFLKHAASRAFDKEDNQSATILKELLSKSYPSLKSTSPAIEFDLPENSTPLDKANAVLVGVSKGLIPPDVGVMLIQAAKHTIDIEIGTELKDRIEALEKLADEHSS